MRASTSTGSNEISPDSYAPRAKRTLKKPSFLWEYRITAKDYMKETSPQEREFLREALSAALLHFLSASRPVYLDKLGILLPIISSEHSSHDMKSTHVIKKDKCLRIIFEKCSELIQFHKDEHPSIVELQELTQHLYSRLPIPYQVHWSEKTTRRLLRGLIRSMRTEVVVDGFSGQLGEVGELFALHNRQGDNAEDWYAGANILLSSNLAIPIKTEICSTFHQPTLESAWELLEAGFGEPLCTFSLDLADELESLGYDKEAFTSQLEQKNQSISIAVFVQDSNEKKKTLVYCTDGLRAYGQSENRFGNEIITQIPVEHALEGQSLETAILPPLEAAPLPRRLLTLGWILLQARKDKTIVPGLGLSADCSLAPNLESELSGIFATPYQRIPLPQRGKNGPFSYINILGVTEDELRFSELRSPRHLTSLLRCKRIDQINNPKRKSIFAKGEHRAPECLSQQRQASM